MKALPFAYGDAPFPRGTSRLSKSYWEAPVSGCAITQLRLINRPPLMLFLLRSRASLSYGYLTLMPVFWKGLRSPDKFFINKAINSICGMERTDCVSCRSGQFAFDLAILSKSLASRIWAAHHLSCGRQ